MLSDSARAFKQPEGQPSRVSAFIWVIKLSNVVSSALRTIVSNLFLPTRVGSLPTGGCIQHAGKKAKHFHGFVGATWEEKAIAYHDTALNRWAESLPEHCEQYTPICLHNAYD